MDEDEHQGELGDGGGTWGVSERPGEGGKKKEEGEQVGEGRVGAVPGIFRFCANMSGDV